MFKQCYLVNIPILVWSYFGLVVYWEHSTIQSVGLVPKLCGKCGRLLFMFYVPWKQFWTISQLSVIKPVIVLFVAASILFRARDRYLADVVRQSFFSTVQFLSIITIFLVCERSVSASFIDVEPAGQPCEVVSHCKPKFPFSQHYFIIPRLIG